DQGGLAVVDMGDDGDIAQLHWAYGAVFLGPETKTSPEGPAVDALYSHFPPGSNRTGAPRREADELDVAPCARLILTCRGMFHALLVTYLECKTRPLRLPGLYAVVRHLCPRLSPDVPGARLHAAAGAVADRRLPAGVVAGALHRREYRAGQSGRFRLGRRGHGQRHAYPGAADARYRGARQGGRQGHGAGPRFGLRRARALFGILLSAQRRDRRRHRSAHRLSRRQRRGAAGAAALRNRRAPAAERLPAAGLRPDPARPLSDRQSAIFQWLPVSLRVLRHPRALRPAA